MTLSAKTARHFEMYKGLLVDTEVLMAIECKDIKGAVGRAKTLLAIDPPPAVTRMANQGTAGVPLLSDDERQSFYLQMFVCGLRDIGKLYKGMNSLRREPSEQPESGVSRETEALLSV